LSDGHNFIGIRSNPLKNLGYVLMLGEDLPSPETIAAKPPAARRWWGAEAVALSVPVWELHLARNR